jgi:hypothetical protein
MANDQAKRSLLDQLTDSATQTPAVPAALTPPGGDMVALPTPIASGSTTLPGSTANLESIAASPDTLNANIEATKQSSTNEHPGFLKTLARLAGGATGFTDPNSSPQANLGARIGALAGRTGNAMAEAAGTPEQKQLAEERNQQPLKIAQLQNEMQYRNGLLNNKAQETGIHQQNADTKGQVADQQGAVANAKIPNLQIDTEKKAFELETMKSGQFPVDPVTAQLVNRPDLANKAVSPTLWKGMNSVLQARGLHVTDLAQDGLWVLDRAGNKVHQISAVSPSMARGEAYGANRPVQALDNEGNAVWMRAGDAERQGAAPLPLGSQIMSKQAQFKDIYSGLANMRHAVTGIGAEPLDATTIAKLTMATRETDPTVAQQEIDTILGSQNLSPAQQDFVIAIQQLNERALSLRNLAGMGNGSDQMRAAIRATLPNAKSGNPQMMLKQLDAVTNLVDNLYTGVPKINAKGSKTEPAANSSKSLTLQEAQDYLQKAGGDANKARALAKKDGRSF